MKTQQKIFKILLVTALILAPLVKVSAKEARIFLSSGYGVYPAGKDIITRLIINSGGNAGINAAEGIIKFDPKFLKIKSINKKPSIFTLWPTEPKFSNASGTIEFGGGSPTKYKDTAGQIFTITFTPLKSGKTDLTIATTTAKILTADGIADNILKEKFQSFITFGNSSALKSAASLTKKMSGKILLQVEKNGEAWYVYPTDNRRYFLGRPEDAFNLMRKLGLGVNHAYIKNYKTFPAKVLGKILIDVEDDGRAYYIYPVDKKAYYLGRPKDAFRIMREKGLGIKNSELDKIDDWAI
ncbi:cohesin domain-containing protein [Candidatus Parcubacteria bacterium]|nr:cohesin domain-containing protein [Patescibacteria group bacterium]MBU4309760.1 cohesin domain-containing protein [Patescibacteria group bacterium]MBU4431766.1 cohesin domain-containing protein [Patescibacteria group bacterium]MBU4578099.1 cohesin domain-containing protein [Patescibacteria group bacterium]MCG2696636.1 cohesin domain-containing protein [Candidatus Parcubacteria bacterium]